MSVEQKIRELMQGKTAPAAQEQLDEASLGAENVSKDTSIKAANAGDTTQPRQGSSQDASYEERESDEENQGAVASRSTPSSPRPANKGAGAAPNFQTVGDPTSVVNMPGSAGNVSREETDINVDFLAILGEDATEEFKTKAASLFEAVVVARVNSEVEKLSEALREESDKQITEAKEQMVEKVDAYLSYVVEQWLEDNKLAVDTGLRTEISEDFITGLKALFEQHYIEIPEDKYDVVAESQTMAEALEEKLTGTMVSNIELKAQVIALKKANVFEAQAKGLAATEVEKLQKLIEGVEFDNEELYAEKIKLIKETHFPKGKSTPADQLTEDVTAAPSFESNDIMSKYVQSISRTAKSRQ